MCNGFPPRLKIYLEEKVYRTWWWIKYREWEWITIMKTSLHLSFAQLETWPYHIMRWKDLEDHVYDCKCMLKWVGFETSKMTY